MKDPAERGPCVSGYPRLVVMTSALVAVGIVAGVICLISHLRLLESISGKTRLTWWPLGHSVKTVTVEGARLSSSELAWVLQQKQVVDLRLGEAAYTANELVAINGMMNLEVLSVRCESVDREFGRGLRLLPKLSVLLISGCQVVDEFVQEVSENENIVYLSFSSCRLKASALNRLASMKALTVLNIIESEIDGLPEIEFEWTKEIRSVQLDGSKFDREWLDTFNSKYDGRLLSLSGCDIADADLFRISGAVRLDVRNTNVTNDAATAWEMEVTGRLVEI